MISRLTPVAALMASAVIAGAANAETRPRAGAHDSRITYATYQSGQVYTVPTKVRNVTLIELGDGESIRSIAVGDSESFQVDKLEGSNVFTVKPVMSGVSTNMTVETNRRFYFMNVIENNSATPAWSLKFTVPGSGTRANAAPTVRALPTTPVQPMRYRVLSKTSGAEFAPIGVSDDGSKTYFQIPPGAPVPTIFRADARGRETAVNSTANGTIITVAARSERWVLRYGDDHACVSGE